MRNREDKDLDVALTVVAGGMDDWWLIERAEHDGTSGLERIEGGGLALWCASRITNADVEGFGSEMLALADAIERGAGASFKRCAAITREDGRVALSSPRNSIYSAIVPRERALELAAKIRATVKP